MKKGLLFTTLVVLLSGCGAQNIQITKQDALELCLDASGFQSEEVTNTNVKKDNGFIVSFDSKEKDYKYFVSTEGIITKREISALPPKPEPSVEQNSEEVKDEETATSGTDEQEAVQEQEYVQEATFSQEMIASAYVNTLVNYNISEEQLVDTSIMNESQDTLTIRLYVNDGRNIVSVTGIDGSLIDSYVE